MPRIRLILAYDGTHFNGWQVQETSNDSQRTVQGVIEQALHRLADEKLRVHASGRTDAGVHALGQNAHFDAPAGRSHIPWQKALNALLPEEVRVLDASEAPDDFHARYSAVSKTYAYSFWLSGRYILPQRRHYTWHPGPLDNTAMLRASEMLLGKHDFSGFQNVGTEVESTVRTLTELAPGDVDGLGATGREQVWRISADGFLKQMARNIFGLLAEVGRGKLAPEDAAAVLKRRNRAGEPYATAPAKGLTLACVRYE